MLKYSENLAFAIANNKTSSTLIVDCSEQPNTEVGYEFLTGCLRKNSNIKNLILTNVDSSDVAFAFLDAIEDIYLEAHVLHQRSQLNISSIRMELLNAELYHALEEKIESFRELKGDDFLSIFFIDPAEARPLILQDDYTGGIISTHPIAPSISFFERPDLINVSGYQNNCGLFALNLALNLAYQNTNNADLPEYYPLELRITSISDVSPGSSKAKELGEMLRLYLYRCLKQDVEYKQRRMQTFIQICSAALNKEQIAFDAASFTLSNQENIAQLIEEAELLQSMVFSLPDNIEALITPNTQNAATFRQFLIELLQDNITQIETNVGLLLKDKVEVTDIAKLVHDFNSAWNLIQKSDGSDENRRYVRELFSSSIYRLMRESIHNTTDSTEQLYKYKVFSSLLALGFATPNPTDNVAFLFFDLNVSENWDPYYDAYLSYIRDKHPMLTLDELASFANSLRANLNVECPNGEIFNYTHDNNVLTAHLSNLDDNHFQVRIPITPQTFTASSSSSETPLLKSELLNQPKANPNNLPVRAVTSITSQSDFEHSSEETDIYLIDDESSFHPTKKPRF